MAGGSRNSDLNGTRSAPAGADAQDAAVLYGDLRDLRDEERVELDDYLMRSPIDAGMTFGSTEVLKGHRHKLVVVELKTRRPHGQIAIVLAELFGDPSGVPVAEIDHRLALSDLSVLCGLDVRDDRLVAVDGVAIGDKIAEAIDDM
jgi:hypothetical protein